MEQFHRFTTFNSIDRRCECCHYFLINDYNNFKYIEITFKFKHRVTFDSFNRMYTVIYDTFNGEYTREEGEGKTKLRDRARTHSSNTIPQIEGQLRVCGNSQFQIFALHQMCSQNRNLRLWNKVSAKILNNTTQIIMRTLGSQINEKPIYNYL